MKEEDVRQLEELISKMIDSLQKQVVEKVPEYGTFDVVYEREDVSDLHIGLSHLILKVCNVQYVGRETERFLEFAAVNYPNPYGAETVVGFGSTQDIIAKLKEEGLVDLLAKKVKSLADEIDYIESHPYG